jgi:hypothetical protein
MEMFLFKNLFIGVIDPTEIWWITGTGISWNMKPQIRALGELINKIKSEG